MPMRGEIYLTFPKCLSGNWLLSAPPHHPNIYIGFTFGPMYNGTFFKCRTDQLSESSIARVKSIQKCNSSLLEPTCPPSLFLLLRSCSGGSTPPPPATTSASSSSSPCSSPSSPPSPPPSTSTSSRWAAASRKPSYDQLDGFGEYIWVHVKGFEDYVLDPRFLLQFTLLGRVNWAQS